MRKTPLLLLLLLMVAIADGQSDTLKKYLDAGFRLTTKNKAVYHALAIKEGFHKTFRQRFCEVHEWQP